MKANSEGIEIASKGMIPWVEIAMIQKRIENQPTINPWSNVISQSRIKLVAVLKSGETVELFDGIKTYQLFSRVFDEVDQAVLDLLQAAAPFSWIQYEQTSNVSPKKIVWNTRPEIKRLKDKKDPDKHGPLSRSKNFKYILFYAQPILWVICFLIIYAAIRFSKKS